MKNIAASVRARLLNLSRSDGDALDVLMEQYVTGRFLYRLVNSNYRDRFVLKGAQLFRLWNAEKHRQTRDLDFLGYGDSSVETVRSVFVDIIGQSIDPDDGLEWGDIKAAPIRDDLKYGGVRALIKVKLDGAQITLQIDVGFGDSITPAVMEMEWQGLLDFPSARLLAYPPETVVAEKFEAAVILEMANSRMKDFFDLDWLASHQEFDAGVLGQAIRNTFDRRQTALPPEIPVALSKAFSLDAMKQTQWNAFLRKNRLQNDGLEEVIDRLGVFLDPFCKGTDPSPGLHWIREKGWRIEG